MKVIRCHPFTEGGIPLNSRTKLVQKSELNVGIIKYAKWWMSMFIVIGEFLILYISLQCTSLQPNLSLLTAALILNIRIRVEIFLAI